MFQQLRQRLLSRRKDTQKVPPDGFIDIHAHVIPGVDDGPETWEESMAILRVASAQGTAAILTTPHGDTRARWDTIDTLTNGCQRLNERCQAEDLPLSILLGMENPLSPDLPARLKKGSALSMNNSSHVLVELPYAVLPLYWEEVLFQLQLEGMRPIIAHPERQVQIQTNPELLVEPVRRGVLVQLTAASLSRRFGSQVRKAAEQMLRQNLVHIIASDTHASEGIRSPVIQEGYLAASRIVGAERAVAMVSKTPRLIALGEDTVA